MHSNTKFAEIFSRHDYSRKTEARGQGNSDPKNFTHRFTPQDAATYRIWDSYL